MSLQRCHAACVPKAAPSRLACQPSQSWQLYGTVVPDSVPHQRDNRCRAAQPGSLPRSAPLASTTVRGSTTSDAWTGADLAELDSVSHGIPVVDDYGWDDPAQNLHEPMGFSDMESIENVDSQGGAWGQWGGKDFAASAALSQQQWQVMPGDLEPIEHYDGTINDGGSGEAYEGGPSSARHGDSPAQAPVVHISEDEPERYRFHSLLYAAAMRGDPDEVASILTDMEDSRLMPGPAAQHALVFAHIKSGNAMEGLRAARESVRNGIAPLEETYVALVFGLVEEGLVESAEGVVLSMYNAGRDTRNGWLALAKGLFRKGLADLAFQHLQKGLQEGWNPDASLYEHVLRAFCASGNVEQAQRVLSSMPDLGVPPRALHFNILVEAIARTAGLDAVVSFIRQGFSKTSAYEGALEVEGQQQDVATPTADTFCAIFRGLMDPACAVPVESATENAQVANLMQELEVTPGPRILSLGLRRYLQDGELDLALEQVATLRNAAGDDWSEYVPDDGILALLTGCGRAERPLDLAVLLRELDRRGKRLSGAALPAMTDAAGRSVSALTSWLPARVGSMGDASTSMLEGGLASELLSTSSVANYDGTLKEVTIVGKKEDATVYIGIANCVVDETGRPMAVSKMRRHHVVAELEARGSDTSGKVAELKSTLQLQRTMLEARIDAWFKQNEDEGGLMMSRVRALIASGMSMSEAMLEVQKGMKQQLEVPPSAAQPAASATSDDDTAVIEEPKDEELQDDFGIEYRTEFQIVQYDNWDRVLETTITYGEMDEEDRAAVRKLRKYEQPSSGAGSLASRRQDALRGVVDDAQVTLERGAGWDDEDAAAEGGLLGQFEGDMMDSGDEDETSLSDGVGAPAAQPELGDSAVGLMEDGDDDGVPGLDDDHDDDVETAAVLDDEAGEEKGASDGSVDALDEDAAELLGDEDIDVDTTVDVLDLSGQTNESAGLEVAVECLRCARLIGLVISSGDFETALHCARSLDMPEVVMSLHGWALDQASELLVDPDRLDDVAIRSFTREFVATTRSTLQAMGHADRIDALQMNEEDADFL